MTCVALGSACLCSLSGCIDESSQSKDNSSDQLFIDELSDSLKEDQHEMVFDLECLKEPNRICEGGLNFVQLGDSLSLLSFEGINVEKIIDSTVSSGGYNWMVKEVIMPKGAVTIEGEFIDDRNTKVELAQTRVNRIRIETPDYMTSDNLGVGSLIRDLKSQFPDTAFFLVPIPQFNAISIGLTNGSRLNYIIRDEQNNWQEQDYAVETISELPENIPISAIVIM